MLVSGGDAAVASDTAAGTIKHHPVFKAAVKPGLRQYRYTMDKILHVGPTGLHSRLLHSPYAEYMPVKGRPLKKIIGNLGAEGWLKKLSEAMLYLESEYPGDYPGLHDAFERSVKRIGGASGIGFQK